MSVRNEQQTGSASKHSPLRLAVGSSPVRLASSIHSPPLTLEMVEVMTRALLDRIQTSFTQRPDQSGQWMTELQAGLRSIQATSDAASWDKVTAICLAHPVARQVWQDPFTHHSFRKPKGYAGDAQLLDYLYGLSPAPGETTSLGKMVFDHMMAQQGALSVRARGEILGGLIDETCTRFQSARVLSVACGHLREGVYSKALMEDRIGELVAFDQDAASLQQVQQQYAGKRVRIVEGSVRDLLGGKVRFEGFHFVYAAGLYDYLSERVASRLTRIMFDMLVPGGRMLVANFAPVLPEQAYMETFMDWRLIYRTAEEMAKVSQEIGGDEWRTHRLFWDEHENVIFLDVSKRLAPARDLAEGSDAAPRASAGTRLAKI